MCLVLKIDIIVLPLRLKWSDVQVLFQFFKVLIVLLFAAPRQIERLKLDLSITKAKVHALRRQRTLEHQLLLAHVPPLLRTTADNLSFLRLRRLCFLLWNLFNNFFLFLFALFMIYS